MSLGVFRSRGRMSSSTNFSSHFYRHANKDTRPQEILLSISGNKYKVSELSGLNNSTAANSLSPPNKVTKGNINFAAPSTIAKCKHHVIRSCVVHFRAAGKGLSSMHRLVYGVYLAHKRVWIRDHRHCLPDLKYALKILRHTSLQLEEVF